MPIPHADPIGYGKAMLDKNKKAYTASNIVWHYAQLNQLQPAEKTILDLFKDRLPAMKMLDIGVGGGRTTQHFSSLAGEYTGIDYSPEMISACQQRFSNSSKLLSFQVGDARNMSQFADNSFDFILFSFNGIDSVSHCDRLQVFQEVRRVGKPGCYFCFSSHNLQSMAKEFSYKKHISLNPLKTYVNFVMLTLLKLFNSSITHNQLETADYLIIKDESHNFRLQNYYIRPSEQIKQLMPDFGDVEMYCWKSGTKIVDTSDRCVDSDLWLYYLCVAN